MDELVRCPKQRELLNRVQQHLLRLAELAHEEAALVTHDDPRWKEVDQSIENELGEKERALGALKEHRKDTAANEICRTLKESFRTACRRRFGAAAARGPRPARILAGWGKAGFARMPGGSQA